MKSILDNNIAVIKKNNSALYGKIADLNDSDLSGIYIKSSKTAGNIPVVIKDNNELYIHSKFDPVKEAARFIAEINPHDFDLFIVFGFGFAYHIEELMKKISVDSTLLVLEKDPRMIRSAIVSRDLSALLADHRLKILVDPDEDIIAGALQGRSSRRVSFLNHRGSFQLDPEYYSNLIRIAKSYLSSKEVNIATLSKFEKTWSSNIARNINEFINLPGANIFYKKFTGIPAIVAGAGPSLTDSLDFIRHNTEKALIICVDTSYSILRKNGIIPHFCVTVDPQLINVRYFEGDVKGSTVFIADPSVHPSVFRLVKGNIASTGMAFEMMKWIEGITGEKGELAYGGSVMTNAYDFAKRCDASPVVLVGQDLSFTKGLAHARGSYLDEEVFLRQDRFFNAHMKNRMQLTALPKIKLKGIRSPEVYTNQKLMIFLKWFERRNDPDLINASFDGAIIKGIKTVPAAEIVFPEIRLRIPESIALLYSKAVPGQGEIESAGKILINRISESLKELDMLLPVVSRAASLSDELAGIIQSGRKDSKLDYILKKLSEADRLIESKNTLKDMIGFTVQRVIHTINEGYEIDEADAALSKEALVAKKSGFLYKGILEGSMYNRKILTKMLKLLENY